MRRRAGKEIVSIYRGQRAVSAIYRGVRLVWTAVSSVWRWRDKWRGHEKW